MKNKIVLFILFIVIGTSASYAACNYKQQISPEEFRVKQKEFITKEVGLTESESKAFFKVYYELQDKKRANQKEISSLMRKAREELTEKEYNDVLVKVYTLRKANADLDLEYYYKFADILPKSKVYQVIRSESKFQRQIIRGMHHKQNKKGKS